MFRGTHYLNLDVKGRLAIPAGQRTLLAEYCESRLIVTADPQRCLIVYPEPHFVEVERKLSAMPAFAEATRVLQRIIIGYAISVQPDSQGRILLAPSQRDFAGLNKQVALVGVGNRYELWDEACWREKLGEAEAFDLKSLAEDPAMAGFSL
ncbi:division/cell wall cluster transcriptional repressor MraZ [Thiohalocapsa marina]|uniref:division/cell wall cluster transcriptional repressor MraZ n=1 Tax=Thiohalocapsa marina TaxID=424902 RepID=UPI0036DA8632